MMFYQKILLLCMLGLGISNLYAQKENVPIYMQHTVNNDDLSKIENRYERFKQQNLGHFSSEIHSEEVGDDPQEFIVIPIFQDTRPGEFWIYIEFFSPVLVNHPIEQRIQRYSRLNRDTLYAETYHFHNPENYINEWKKEIPFEHFDIEDELFHDETCDAYMMQMMGMEYGYKVVPVGKGCDLRSTGEARYTWAEFEITDEGYNMCVNFLNIDYEPVKECPDGGLMFKRLDHKDKKYEALGPMIKRKKMKFED